ncbi:PhzF family phenazine biosynthesis protein [Nonomuraea sp. NPDC049141]|uniref:PhzF family phenazine biosynthesis protein n=1 Tax=Nonomuraea sp. NPDC049141 TaxID=3155500 RepID=UPI0033C701F9
MDIGYHHVDVFSDRPFTGNSLAVLIDPPPLSEGQMARLTQELRHFETIFVRSTEVPDVVHARVFDLVGELDFAGHPVLGAAAVLHESSGVAYGEDRHWSFVLGARNVDVTTRGETDGQVLALLDQGRPELVQPTVPREPVAAALGLTSADLDDTLPPEIISTGLRYLVVPVRDGDVLARARITHPDFEGFLGGLGAQYVYVLDAGAVEGRHWNNDGVLEDVATGSAAGCVAAYLMRHGRARDGQELSLAQGRFTGRPSRIAITAYGTPDAVERVTVGGGVSMVATGTLRALPEAS